MSPTTTSSLALRATTGGSPPPVKSAPQADSEGIVLHTDYIIMLLIALIVLFRLPRVFARFWRRSEWTNGHCLRNLPYHERTTGRKVQFSMVYGPSMSDIDLSADESDISTQEKGSAQRISASGAPIAADYPPHVSSCMSVFSQVLKLMHIRLVPGVSYSRLAVMAVWLGILQYATWYRTNAFTDPVRFGWIAMSQLPFVYALGTKNNVLGMLLGVGYEKLNWAHRFAGRIVLVAINVHAMGFIYKWLIAKTFKEEIAVPKNAWGLFGLICIDCLFFFSTEFWRKKAYNLFLATHIFSLTLVIIAMLLHYEACGPWACACGVIYLLDLLQRVIKTRFAKATLRSIPELGITRLEIPDINSGWRAGQHVRLRVFSSGMGVIGFSEIHPFTIASVSNGPEGMVLLCKKAGDWTTKLFEIAKASSIEEDSRKVSVMVEGPYGGLGNRMIASFSAAVFVVGGSGITFATSAMQELIQNSFDNRSRVKTIELIWTIQDPSALVPMLPLLTSMIQQSVFMPIRVSVFYTRAPTGKFPFSEDFFRSTSLTLSPGRPKLHNHFEEIISRVTAPEIDSNELSGLFVGVCGPVSLADTVFNESRKIDSFRRDQIGGVEIHEETFGW